MKKLAALLVVLSAVVSYTLAAPPQAAAAKDWIDQWKDVTERLIGVADAMPAEKYDYKPTPEVGTFGDQVKHVCLAMRVLLANAEGKQVDLKETNLDALKTKEEILAELRKRVDDGAAVIRRISGKTDAEPVESQFFGRTTRRFLIIQAIAHDNNHYGQLVMYLRLNGITPPASR
ncbi:MAG TPA: DinB family protein [Candidatus Polarisedimenticolia bacterium]|jgi:uncharacterized damage-inducible protein DinB|nr:DinB family protein [Candidatus Polarisedimenticolia bacterium]